MNGVNWLPKSRTRTVSCSAAGAGGSVGEVSIAGLYLSGRGGGRAGVVPLDVGAVRADLPMCEDWRDRDGWRSRGCPREVPGMQKINIVYWEEEGALLGYLQEYPDYWTQGETLEDLKEHLRDLYHDITSGTIPLSAT